MTRHVPETGSIADRNDSEKYWRELLRGISEATPLTLPKREEGRPASHTHSITLTREVTAALHATSASLGITLQPFIHAAWALLLGRYNREDLVVFGSTHSEPSDPDRIPEDAARNFCENLPVRADIGAEVLLSDLLKNLRLQQIATQRHSSVPLSAIEEWSGLSPIFTH